MNYAEIQKQDTPTVRWLHGGTSTDDARPVLQGLQVESDITVAADGWELRIAPTPESLKEFDGSLIKLEKSPRVVGDVVKTHLIEEGDFPEWQQIIPTDQPAYKIAVDGKKLAGLVKDMGAVELVFHSPTQPIIIKSADKYAVLMPMFIAASDEDGYFDPFNQSEQIDPEKESS